MTPVTINLDTRLPEPLAPALGGDGQLNLGFTHRGEAFRPKTVTVEIVNPSEAEPLPFQTAEVKVKEESGEYSVACDLSKAPPATPTLICKVKADRHKAVSFHLRLR